METKENKVKKPALRQSAAVAAIVVATLIAIGVILFTFRHLEKSSWI